MLSSRSRSSSPKGGKKKAVSASSSSSNSSKKIKKSVSFHHNTTVRPIPHSSQFTHKFKQNGWYSMEDYQEISSENNQILSHMMIGGQNMLKHVETSESTTRGLESRTLEGAEHKKISILDGLCAVLLEQERQRQKDEVNEERIREAYLQYTQVPAMAALKQGKLDARCGASEGGSHRSGGAGGKLSKSHKKDFSDLESTDTTLISDETATMRSGESGDSMDGDGEVKKRSMVRRLLKGRLFTKNHRRKSASSSASSSVISFGV